MINKKILKLENNKEYLMLEQIIDENETYLLIMNVDDESDIKIVNKKVINNEDYIVELNDDLKIIELKSKFKSMIDEEKKLF